MPNALQLNDRCSAATPSQDLPTKNENGIRANREPELEELARVLARKIAAIHTYEIQEG
jgi:hypothetical protein